MLLASLVSVLFLTINSSLLLASDTQVRAIYGIDNRYFISPKSSREIREQSSAVAMIIDAGSLEKSGRKFNLKGAKLRDSINLCSDEKFSTRPSLNACTGFLVRSNILITAGHCIVNQEDCDSKKILFDVKESSHKLFSSDRSVGLEQVFSCKKILAHGSNASVPLDFSIIELNRDVPKRSPLLLKTSLGLESIPNRVYMLGHPYGLSMMYSQSALAGVSDENESQYEFKAALDSFVGNSGSPVFNSLTLEVEGILIKGQEDLYFDSINKCYRYSVYNGKGGEGVLRISTILPHL